MFRKLNKQEDEILRTLKQRGKVKSIWRQRAVQYNQHGNFIVAVVRANSRILTGVAKFNPIDRNFNPEIGKNLAFTRAVINK